MLMHDDRTIDPGFNGVPVPEHQHTHRWVADVAQGSVWHIASNYIDEDLGYYAKAEDIFCAVPGCTATPTLQPEQEHAHRWVSQQEWTEAKARAFPNAMQVVIYRSNLRCAVPGCTAKPVPPEQGEQR